VHLLRPVLTVGLLLTLFLPSGCTSGPENSRVDYGDLNSLIDSVTATPAKAGRYSLASEFFEKLAAIRQAEGSDSAHSTLLAFFSRLDPNVRITDSVALLQMVEWIHNCFTMMDSGGVFFTNGAADTYAAWYLQRVEGIRLDLIVVSLPFLVGVDYRQTLGTDTKTRRALNLLGVEDLPVPPSAWETREILEKIITRVISRPEHPPLYLAPRCGIGGAFGGHIVYIGLVHAYQDSIGTEDQLLDRLVLRLTQSWQLHYASRGFPPDPQDAIRNGMIQYLSLLLVLVPEFEKRKRYQDMDFLFARMEPVAGEDWRFSALRYKFCHKTKEECGRYLDKLKQYVAEHPDDPNAREVSRELEDE